MSQDEEIVMRDVTNAGLCIGDRIGREAASQLDLEEALEASRYASHPYSTHPREVSFRNDSTSLILFFRRKLAHFLFGCSYWVLDLMEKSIVESRYHKMGMYRQG